MGKLLRDGGAAAPVPTARVTNARTSSRRQPVAVARRRQASENSGRMSAAGTADITAELSSLKVELRILSARS